MNAEEQGEKDLGQVPRGLDFRWKKLHSCAYYERKWDERALCKSQIEEGNSQGKDPRTFQETAKVETLVHLKQTAS